jgi:hypothetical protein
VPSRQRENRVDSFRLQCPGDELAAVEFHLPNLT